MQMWIIASKLVGSHKQFVGGYPRLLNDVLKNTVDNTTKERNVFMFKNTKKVFAIILAIAVVTMSMFTGVVVSAADTADTTAHGTVDLLEFGDYLVNDLGSSSKYYDSVLADNGETGADWDNAIIIDSAEELVYLCKASDVDTEGKYYKVADGIAGFNLATSSLNLDGTLTSPSKAEGKTNMDIVKGSGKNHSGGGSNVGFRGYFDGNGATVYGAWTNHEQVSPYAGLFSTTVGNVTIKNIHVKMAHFTATTAVGGIVGFHASTDMATLTIENCSVTDSYFEVNSSGWNKAAGAILGCGNSAPAKRETTDGVDYNGDGDTADTIYINDPYIIKNCYVNLDADNFVTVGGFAPGTVAGQQVCRGGVIGVCGSNAAMVSDCVVIGITPYATSISNDNNGVQHSGLESHFQNVYTTENVAVADVAIGGTVGLRQFTGRVFPTADANLKGAAAASLNLDWSVWMLDDEGYPELANAHKNVTLVDKENGTHAATCACGFGGIAVAHTFADGECACGAELNCATRKTIYWDGTVAGGIATGTGAKNDPYVIKSASELAWLIQQKAEVSNGKYFEIDSAIGTIVLQPEAYGEAIKNLADSAAVKAYFEANAGSMKAWPNVGWEQSSFAGEFEGNGVKIYGLYQVSANNAGLFSTVDGGSSFKNIALMNSYITSTATNYQVGGIFAVTSSGSYGAMRNGAVWINSCVVANNYMNNACDSHDRSGVLYGSSSDVIYIDNCLTYGNDATYAGKKMSYGSCALNSLSINSNPVTPDGLELVAEENEQALILNMIRNTIFFDAVPFDNAQALGSRFNDPRCYVNVLTNLALEDYTFAGAEGPVVFSATEEQIKVVSDLADVELPAGFIKTAGMPELKSFHDAVFSGDATAAGAAGHAASCSCGLADSDIQEHVFVSDEEVPEWDSYYCEVCGYVCEHEDGVEENFEADCVTAAGYTFDCPTCGYHEESFEEVAGHNFTEHEAEAGADCQTAGTIAHKSCDVCGKNYAADATDTEPFENAITDLTGEKGECVPVTDPETGDVVYEKDGNNHWTVCSVCEEPIETAAHDGEIADNGDGTHSVTCEICGYASDAEEHHFVSDVEVPEWDSYHCEVCGSICEHEDGVEENFEADCVTAEGYTFDCPTCGYHEENFEEVAGHNFTEHEAEVGPDCQTPGTVAHKHCDVCDKDYAADASDTEAFENALTDLSGEVGPCVELTDDEGNLVYDYDKEAHWTICALCGEAVTTTEHNLDDGPCEICGAVKIIVAEINVPKSGIYTIIPSGAPEDYDMATDVDVFNKLGEIVLYNAKLGGFPLVAGEEYIAIFADGLDLPFDTEVAVTLVETKLFPDTTSGAWYDDAVNYALGSGIMSGYKNGKFGTSDSIQRQDFIVMLARYAGADLTAYENVVCTLTDVRDGEYYEAAVNWALAEGITTGYDNGKFGVGDKMTREQIVTFLYRYAQLIGVDVTVEDGAAATFAAQYADFGKVSSFSKDAIVWALENGVISGKNPTTIAPQGNAQRCEVAQIMYNIFLNEIFAI